MFVKLLLVLFFLALIYFLVFYNRKEYMANLNISNESPEIDKLIMNTMNSNKIPGAIIGIWDNSTNTEKYLKKSYGLSNIELNTPTNINMHFRIASITKSFVSVTILILVDKGKLSLDTTLDKFNFLRKINIDNKNKITVRNLLNMTSGIYSYTNNTEFVDRINRNPTLNFNTSEVIDMINNKPAVDSPGTRFDYSDTNYVLLGYIIEEVSGTSVEKYITEEILSKLNLFNTYLPMDGEMSIRPEYMDGYTNIDGKLVKTTEFNPNIAWTAGSMISNIDDLKVWVRELGTGSLLSKKSFAELNTFIPILMGYPLYFGLGVSNFKGSVGYHGAINGYNTSIYYNQLYKFTFVITCNNSTNFSEEADKIYTALLKGIYDL